MPRIFFSPLLARCLERIRGPDSVSTRARQRELLSGSLRWTKEETGGRIDESFVRAIDDDR